MKKLLSVLIMLMFVCSIAYVCMADSLTTRVMSYQTLNSIADAVDTALSTDPNNFAIGAISGEVDLLANRGAGSETYANAVEVVFYGTGASANDALTQQIYGRAEGGPPQLICSIAWVLGTAHVVDGTTTTLWADTATVTDTHITTVNSADSGNNRVCTVQFDATGFRYIFGEITVDTNDTDTAVCLYRAY
jgi:hypothetical protein